MGTRDNKNYLCEPLGVIILPVGSCGLIPPKVYVSVGAIVITMNKPQMSFKRFFEFYQVLQEPTPVPVRLVSVCTVRYNTILLLRTEPGKVR